MRRLPPEPLARYEEVLRRFPGIRVGVVGDFMADVYVLGTPSRLSREAPVVVLRWEGEQVGPGGAANSANNLLALGARVAAVGHLGDDVPGRVIRERFRAGGADVGGLRLLRGDRTITKTRFLAGDVHRSKQQVLRLDREPEDGPAPGLARRVAASARRLAPRVDAWLVSDYGYGTVTPRVYEALRAGPGGDRRVVVVDSRRRVREFKGATALTPNEEEAGTAVGQEISRPEQVAAAGRALLAGTGAGCVLVTRGNQGLALVGPGGEEWLVPPSGGDEITDNNGAGDTVAAVFTLALAAGASPLDAARLANHAGGVVVMKVGAATLTREELRARYRSAARARARGGR